MQALGVIVEYNPFHNGHLYHLEASKRLTGRRAVVAVMSGNFVQRGEPALCDKWRRTRMALEHGVNLVIELPVYYATAAADYFARAAVRLLHATGLVDCLCFGSESGDVHSIKAAGRLLTEEPPAFSTALKESLHRGLSFAAARAAAVESQMDAPDGLLQLPNNGLGIEYCKALYKLDSAITPYTVTRASGHEYLSASAIRKAIFNGAPHQAAEAMPPSTYRLLAEAIDTGTIARLEAYGDIFQYRLRAGSAESVRAAADMSEGLENRFRQYCGRHRALSELLSAVKTKRYTYTRLQRAALHVILDITAETLEAYESTGGPPYIRVLGFRKDSIEWVTALQQRASLPVVMNLKHAPSILPEPAMRMLTKEIETTGLYTLAYKKSIHNIHHEYTMPLVII